MYMYMNLICAYLTVNVDVKLRYISTYVHVYVYIYTDKREHAYICSHNTYICLKMHVSRTQSRGNALHGASGHHDDERNLPW